MHDPNETQADALHITHQEWQAATAWLVVRVRRHTATQQPIDAIELALDIHVQFKLNVAIVLCLDLNRYIRTIRDGMAEARAAPSALVPDAWRAELFEALHSLTSSN